MNINIGPGREGNPTLYIDNHPVAEVHDVERMNALLQRLERYEKALKEIQSMYDTQLLASDIAEEALKEDTP